MSYNQRNDNSKNRSLWGDGDKRRSNHPYSPNNSTSFYYKKKLRTSFDSNGFYPREGSTVDNYTRNYYHNRDQPRDDSRDSCGRDWSRDSGMGPFGRDRSRHAYRERQTQSDLGDEARDRQDDDRERRDYKGFGDDEKKRLGDFTSRYNNLSRSPSKDRGIDQGDDRDKNRESTSSDRSNTRVSYSIHQDGRLYSDHRMHTPQHHGQQSAFVKRDAAPLRSRWDQPPVDNSPTTIYQYQCDNPSSLLSQAPEMSRPSSVSSQETAAPRSLMNQFSSCQPATTMLISQAASMAASTTTLAVQNAVTNHFHHAQITAHSTMLQYHQQPQQTTPEDSRSKIVEAAADSYKALQNFRKLAGIKAADISVRDIMGKRPVGRPSKARLDTEEAILFGINCANSEMKQLEQATAELQVTTNRNEMVKYRQDIDIDEVERVAPTTRLITLPSSQADIANRSQHQVQGSHQVLQPTRSLKTRREWENYRQNLQGKDDSAPEGPRSQTIRQDSPLQMEPPPPKIMHRGSQPSGSCGEIYVDVNTRVQRNERDERDEGYLGTLRPKLSYRRKVPEMSKSHLAHKKTPQKGENESTPHPVTAMRGVEQGKRKREFIHSDETGQARQNYKCESRTWPRARKGTFTAAYDSFSKTENGSSSTEESRPQLPSTREPLHDFGDLDYDDNYDLPLDAAIYSSRSCHQLAPETEAPLISGTNSPSSLHKQEEATTEKSVSIVFPESLVSISSPSLPLQQSYPPDNNSLNDNVDEDATSPIIPDDVDDQVEVEEAKKRLFACMEQLKATAIRESTPVTEANNSAALSATETPEEKERTETEFQGAAPVVVSNSTQTFISDKNDQEQIKTLPFTATPTTPMSNAYNATSASALPTSAAPPPNYTHSSQGHFSQVASPYYQYWCRCAMDGRPCSCGANSIYNVATGSSGYYHLQFQYTNVTTTEYYYNIGYQNPAATHRTVYSSHDYAWDTPYHHHYNAWNDGGHYGGYQWAPPTFAGHVPSSMASPSTDPSTTFAPPPPPPPPPQSLAAFPPSLSTTSSEPSGATSNQPPAPFV